MNIPWMTGKVIEERSMRIETNSFPKGKIAIVTGGSGAIQRSGAFAVIDYHWSPTASSLIV
jgi:hypothetical protein